MQLKRIHPLDVPLEVFLADLSTKPRNVIRAELAHFDRFHDEDIKPPFTVRHLVMFSRRELKKWPGLGRKGLNEVEELLRARGLQLWDAHDERSLRLLREHATYFTTPPASQEQAQQPNEWREMIQERFDINHSAMPSDPREAVLKLIRDEVAMALDPVCSSQAEALIQRGRDEAQQPQAQAQELPDEREAFEKWLGIKPCGAAHDFGWAAWQARAAMAQG